MQIQNNTYCWIEAATWIKIEESPEYKSYDNSGDFSVRSFWYHSNGTKRNPWGMLYSHCPVNAHPAIYTLPSALQLCYKLLGILQTVTKSQKVHISSPNGLKDFITSTLLDLGHKASLRGSIVAGISPSLIKFFEQRIFRYDWPEEFSAKT